MKLFYVRKYLQLSKYMTHHESLSIAVLCVNKALSADPMKDA